MIGSQRLKGREQHTLSQGYICSNEGSQSLVIIILFDYKIREGPIRRQYVFFPYISLKLAIQLLIPLVPQATINGKPILGVSSPACLNLPPYKDQLKYKTE